MEMDPSAMAVMLTFTLASIAVSLTPTAAVVPGEVLHFWFRTDARRKWFAKNARLDAEIRARFGRTIKAALGGRLRKWEADPKSAVALIIVLDQFTRNAFRGSPAAYSGDAEARRIARAIDVSGLSPHERWFAAMPFQHSERMEDQVESVERFRELAGHGPEFEDALGWAVKHYDVIDKFGRFPHRNAVLGRTTSPSEKLTTDPQT